MTRVERLLKKESKIRTAALFSLSLFSFTSCIGFNNPAQNATVQTTDTDGDDDSSGGSGGSGGGGGGGGGGSSGPSCADVGSSTSYSVIGSGTKADPYWICTAAQLVDLSQPGNAGAAWSRHFIVKANLDMTGFDESSSPAFAPIGTNTTPFTGTFDGNLKTISNLSYSAPTNDYVGLFGKVSGASTHIRDLTLTAVDLTGDAYVGGLVGQLVLGARITNTSTAGAIVADGSGTAGGAGGDCLAETCGAGGLVGAAESGSIVSTSRSSVTVNLNVAPVPDQAYRGGLVGALKSGAMITRSFSTGTARGRIYTGGLVGILQAAVISNSYTTATVNCATEHCGVLIGTIPNLRSRVENSFAAGSIGNPGSVGHIGFITGTNQGHANVTFLNNWYYGPACTNCNVQGGSVSPTDATYFHSKANSPLDVWDSTNTDWDQVWAENAGNFPTPVVSYLDEDAWGTCASPTAHAGSDPNFAGGYGTIENPWLICTAAQLDRVGSSAAYRHGKAYRVMTPIDLTAQATPNIPIGEHIANTGDGFSGVFDGNGKAISNWTLARDIDTTGFFGWIVGGLVHRIALENVSLTSPSESHHFYGSVAGTIEAGLISDCYASGNIDALNSSGLVAGTQDFATIRNCYVDVNVIGRWAKASGILATHKGTLENVFSLGNTTSYGDIHRTIDSTQIGVSATYTDIFYDQASTCSSGFPTPAPGACTSSIGTAVDLVATPNYFFDSSSAVFATWDFENVWETTGSALPTLR